MMAQIPLACGASKQPPMEIKLLEGKESFPLLFFTQRKEGLFTPLQL